MTMYGFGDSITVGVNAPYSYLNVVSAYYNVPRVNKAISGSQIAHQVNSIYNTTFNSDDTSLFLTGFNDMRYLGANSGPYEDSLKAMLAWMGTSSKAKAINLPVTGAWSATPVNSIGRNSTDVGATISTTVESSVVYVAAIQQSSNNGSFKVTVDGIDYGPYQTRGGAAYSNNVNYSPYLIRIGDLSNAPHSVVVTVLSGQVFIDWIGSPTQGQAVYVSGCMKMTASGYTLGAPFNNGSDALAEQYTGLIQSAVSQLAADGLRIFYVPLAYDQNTQVSNDNVHPKESGQVTTAVSFIKTIGF